VPLHKPWRDDEVRDQVGAAFRHHEVLYGKGQGAGAAGLPRFAG